MTPSGDTPTSSSVTAPTPSTAAAPHAAARIGSSTAACSIAEHTAPMVSPDLARSASVPRTARLSDSVPPDVNTISVGSAPSTCATRSRASSTATRASRAIRCEPEALPKRSAANGAIASITSGRTGDVAAWSR